MHFKDFFYRQYYTRSFPFRQNNQANTRNVDLAKPINKEAFQAIKDKNNPVFQAANDLLKSTGLQPGDYYLLEIPTFNGVTVNPISFTTVYPGLILGTGYVHETNNEAEFKLGFYFDHTTGLPCIPGSSIKGVLRSMFPQFGEKHPYKAIDTLNEEQQSKVDFIARQLGWDQNNNKSQLIHQLELAIFEGVDLVKTSINFNNGKEEIIHSSIYKRFCFHNGFISHAPGNKIFEIDTITPHGTNPLKNPTPLNFLKIRPNVTFNLQIIMHTLTAIPISTVQIRDLFISILRITGLGAKTNVGYGQW